MSCFWRPASQLGSKSVSGSGRKLVKSYYSSELMSLDDVKAWAKWDGSRNLKYFKEYANDYASQVSARRNRQIAEAIGSSSEQMKKEGWQSPNPKHAGAFGGEVHRRTSKELAGKSDICTDVYVDDRTWKIRSIGKEKPGFWTKGTTQIDVVAMKTGQDLKVGAVWNPSKVDTLVEIKSSVSGPSRRSSQVLRLKTLAPRGNVHVAPSKYRMNSAGRIIENPRWSRGMRILSAVPAALAVYSLLQTEANAAELDDFVERGDKLAVQAHNLAIAGKTAGPDYNSHLMDVAGFEAELVIFLSRFDPVGADGIVQRIAWWGSLSNMK